MPSCCTLGKHEEHTVVCFLGNATRKLCKSRIRRICLLDNHFLHSLIQSLGCFLFICYNTHALLISVEHLLCNVFISLFMSAHCNLFVSLCISACFNLVSRPGLLLHSTVRQGRRQLVQGFHFMCSIPW
jgi:hypothetical protein